MPTQANNIPSSARDIRPIVYYQLSTSNKSFRDMHYYLRSIGIKNNKFFLALIDKDLAGVDPFDPKLNQYMKQKIFRECMVNYWYFIREVIRIPDQGGNGAKYELHRGNLAFNYCSMLNLNIFEELPRQQFKTISAICRYIYIYNFGTTNSEIKFLHQKMSESKLNLERMKNIIDMLPSYLRMNKTYSSQGRKNKGKDTIEKLVHPLNGNTVTTAPSARNKFAASNILRGRTVPLVWADEWAFIPFNDTIYLSGVPAFKTASLNAKKNGAPYGFLLTTTPGFLATEEGLTAYNMKEEATPFNEAWYDMTYQQIMEIINANTKSNFVYIKFTYQQLGRSEEWYKSICKDMLFKWEDIRREVNLEWSLGTSNSPFTTEDLETVARLVKEPRKIVYFLGKYIFNIYDEIELRNGMPKYPPLIGVDVSGGYNRDSSAICCVDSFTTKVFADLKCNYISTPELASVIYELVTKYMNNAVVNVERNGGYGASVLAKLIHSNIKKNLYFEIKDKIIEEQNTGTRVIRRTRKTKVYGLDSTKTKRELLIQILRERMDNHKDKFVSKRIYDELVGMEVKKSGKVEHSANTHDDLVFAYLMAMYMWYEGKDLKEHFNITKTTIKTDESIDEPVYGLDENLGDITEELRDASRNDDASNDYVNDLKKFAAAHGKLYQEWALAEQAKDQAALKKMLRNKAAREAYAKEYNISKEELDYLYGDDSSIPNEAFVGFTKDHYDDMKYLDPRTNPNNKVPPIWHNL